ncbi:Decaprenyl diphosphate synthase-like protein [Aspergillus novoparasiticus]|uniref:ditrans,polycis-polyprenyl diphosphate synthase [(2E,6E)-farnesyldiphosphate specific] n=1 Tax=Aspergillus novoparasiticus TaxID=986946 RepID=A0A5N6EP81_9EURO|nr:Decaprenyl diphosphate synthase-like protein [Aspergillus novoparasiticus]
MVSQRDKELLRDDVRARGTKLSAADRESLLKPYLPDPSELPLRPPQRRRKTSPRKTPIRTFLKSQLHQLTYTLIHIFFGIVVRLVQSYHAVIDRVFAIVYYHHRTPELIRKDVKNLDRLPEHLSVILSLRHEEDSLTILMDEVAELAAWSVSAGIPVLSVYEKSGVLKSCIPTLHRIVTNKLSAYYGSPSQQPTLRLFAPHHPVYQPQDGHSTEKANTDSVTVLLLSATDGRETFVDLTKTLAEMSQNGKLSPEDITMELVDAEISEITTQPSQTALPTSAGNKTISIPDVSVKPEPDLLLVFRPFLKLDGYPPWHIRLTEMYCTGDKSNSMTGYGEAVEYQGFLRGLWHYAGAQMRFGR